MDNIEQTTETTEQTSTPGEVEQHVEQQQGNEGSEVELTEEQQAEATAKQAEEEKAAQRQAAIDKRFAKLTWEKNEALRKAQELEQKYAKHEQSSKAEPQLHEFDSIDDYAKAIREYQSELAKKEYHDQYEQQRIEQMRQAQSVKIDAAETEFLKTNPDYNNVVSNLVNLTGGQLPEELSVAVLELGSDAPAVLYEMAKDPADVAELLDMSPTQQLMKLGEIRATLKNSPKTPIIPNTPAPVSPAKGVTNSKKDPYKGSDDEFLRSRGLA